MPIQFHSILISDVHLGSPMCQAKELREFLANIRVKMLILNGDIFEDLKFYRLSHWHWEAFGMIRKISDHCKVTWIRGNHDVVDAKFMSHLLGVKVKGQVRWTVGGRRLYATHGDRWDAYIYKYRFLTELLTGSYNFLRGFSSSGMRSFTKFVKKRSKLMLRNHEAIQANAISFGRELKFDGVFCGHTHMAAMALQDGVVYGNSGTWESDVPHFIGINPEGAYLCRYEQGDKYHVVASYAFEGVPDLLDENEPILVPIT